VLIKTSKKQDSKSSPLPKGVHSLALEIKKNEHAYHADLDSLVINSAKSSSSVGPFIYNGKACFAIEWGATNSIVPMNCPEYTALVNKAIRIGKGKAKPVKRVDEVIEAQINDTLMESDDIEAWEFNAFQGEGPESGVVINCNDEKGHALLLKNGQVEVLTEPTGINFIYSSKNSRFEYLDKKITSSQFHDFRMLFSNLSYDQFFLLVGYISFVITHPRSEGLTYPIAYIHGGPGCGKTTIARMTTKILGMKNASVQTMPASVKDLVATVSNNLRIIWDNVSHIKTEIANASCNVSTGGTISNRTLYTNTGVTETSLHKPLMITAIELTHQSDLMDRCVFFNALKPTVAFTNEAEMHQSLTDILPEVQTWFLDMSAKALALKGSVEVIGEHRASTFREWLAMFEKALGFEDKRMQKHFSASFNDTIKRQSVTFDPVLSSIVQAVKKLAPLGGTPDQVHFALTSHVEAKEGRTPKNWPANANAMSHKLGKLSEILPKHGLVFDRDRKKDSKGRRQWLLNTIKDGAKISKPNVNEENTSYPFFNSEPSEVSNEVTEPAGLRENNAVVAEPQVERAETAAVQTESEELVLDDEATAEYETEQQAKFEAIENQPEYHDPELQAMLAGSFDD
jgi:hypothetical protein